MEVGKLHAFVTVFYGSFILALGSSMLYAQGEEVNIVSGLLTFPDSFTELGKENSELVLTVNLWHTSLVSSNIYTG